MDQLLAVGGKGPSVVELQKLLNQKLGPQVALNPDGQYGAKTKSAVNKFQEVGRSGVLP